MKTGRIFQFLGGFPIAGAGLFIFFRDVDGSRLLRELAATPVWVLFACVILKLVSVRLRAVRWRLILPEPEGNPLPSLFSVTIIGFMLNNIFPARMGEAARAFLLWRRHECRPLVSVGSLVVERAIDFLTYGSFFCIPVLLLPALGSLRSLAWVFSGMIIGTLACGTWYVHAPAVPQALGNLFLKLLPVRLRGGVRSLAKGFTANLLWMRSPKRAAAIGLLTLPISLAYAAMIFLLIGTPSYFGLLKSLFTQSMVAIGAAIPLAPGYVGTVHATMFKALALLDISEARARAVAILFHAMTYLPVTLLGLYYFMHTGIRWRDLSKVRTVSTTSDNN